MKNVKELLKENNKIILGTRYVNDLDELFVFAIIKADFSRIKDRCNNEYHKNFGYMIISDRIKELEGLNDLKNLIINNIEYIKYIDKSSINYDEIDSDKCASIFYMGMDKSYDDVESLFKYKITKNINDLPKLDNIKILLNSNNKLIDFNNKEYFNLIKSNYNINKEKFNNYCY